MDNSIFISISLVLSITIAVAFLVQILKQPLIISYIIAGVISGPVFLNLINSELHFFDIFAQFGVVLLLFIVGLSLDIDYLRKIGKVSAVTGIGQVLFTSIFGFLLLLLLDFPVKYALFLAISITFSSTIIIIKLLNDKQDTRSVYGRYTIGLMLVQDIIAILIMILLPSFMGDDSFWMAILLLLSKVIIVLSVVYFLSKFILPLILEKVAKNGEFLLLFSLAWCFSIAGFGEWAGISLEVGAIVAGLSLGSSIYQTDISSRIKPLRDFFIAMFFIILGSEMNIENFSQVVVPGIILSVFILVGNPAILYFLFRRMKFTRRSSFLAGVTAAQVSEFGFVLLFLAYQMGYVENYIISIFTLVALVTIFVSSFLITYNNQIFNFFIPFLNLFGKDKYKNPPNQVIKYDVLIFGYHRLGWRICEILKQKNITFAIIDFNPEVIKKLKQKNIPCFFGDATDVEFLAELPVKQTKMVISTLPRAEDQLNMIRHAKKENNKTIIIGNLSHVKFIDNLYEAGANYVMVPHLLAGHWMADILDSEKWNKSIFSNLHKKQIVELKLRNS